MVKVALPLTAKLPIVQFGAVHVPVDGVALTKVYPAGNTSFTVTPVAALGPAFEAVIVNVTLLPTFGVGLLTVFVIPRFVDGLTVIVTTLLTDCVSQPELTNLL